MTGPFRTAPPPAASAGRARILFLDPISHAFGAHDAALSRELRALGFEVTVGGNDFRDGARGASPEDAGPRPYRGVVGDGSRIRKFINHWRARNRVVCAVRGGACDAVVLYYVLQPEIDTSLLRALRQTGIPALVVAHDVIPLHRDRDRCGAWGRTWRSAAGVVALSAFARNELITRCRVPADRIFQGRLGMPPSGSGDLEARDAARRRLCLPAGEKTILCFGQLRRNKDLGTLLQGFAGIAGSIPDAKLRIVGRAWHFDVGPVRRRILDLGLEDRVLLHLGWVEDADVPAWFDAADVVAVSYTRIYQSDIVLKAAAHRRPVVATAVGDTPEVVRDGRTGWLVPAGDSGACGGALACALSDPAEAARRAAGLADEVGRRNTWSALAAVIREALAAVAAKTPETAGRSSC